MIKNYILKPFETLQERTLLWIGVFTGLVTCIVQTFTHSRSIALLKQVSIYKSPTAIETISDYVITTFLMTIAVFILGKTINKKTRFIDILNTVLIARIAMNITVLFDINGFLTDIADTLMKNINNPNALNMDSVFNLTIFSILTLCLLIVFGYYMYQGFKTATHLKTKPPIIALVVIILFVDILTRPITSLY
ncbi:hypothetical protein LNQ81_09645 [Myroides sp. M-43]|uniref:hypothetical protein n=1 Tax=Myroides oncorhynchi TaxID=2893756 RepID=UPI001E578EB7|nr:hypothetical protein [Myroides oncorhynchi]MCC9042937.1 hypothetical protein [Myroides oncorhynchi]